MTKDLNEPIIAIVSPVQGDNPKECTLLVIDGWHRMRKADLTNHPRLNIKLLLPEEEERCRIRVIGNFD